MHLQLMFLSPHLPHPQALMQQHRQLSRQQLLLQQRQP
jgi:hypothetical protein